MRPDLSPIDPDEALPDIKPTAERRLRLLPVSVALIALAGFGAIVWYAYTQGMQGGTAVAPVIRAEPGPTKIRPEQPGGLVVPNQDKMVYNNLMPSGSGSSAQVQPERLLPPPETPIPRPAAPTRAAPQPPPAAGGTPAPLTAPAATVPIQLPPGPAPLASGGADGIPVAAVASPPSLPSVALPSASPAAATQGAPAVAAPVLEPGAMRIQIAATKSEDEAKREWQRIQRANQDILGKLQANFVRADLGDKGVFFRVQAGPLNEASARQACDTLKTRKIGCLLVK